MSYDRSRSEGGLPRSNRRSPRPPDTSDKEEGRKASEAMTRKLRQNDLQRRARRSGLELRHSAYGYSLVDGSRNRVDGRNDLTLDEVDAILAGRG